MKCPRQVDGAYQVNERRSSTVVGTARTTERDVKPLQAVWPQNENSRWLGFNHYSCCIRCSVQSANVGRRHAGDLFHHARHVLLT
jgi:hypothetical protein